MFKAFGEFVVRKHSALAGTLFAASALGSFTYTVSHGRSAWLDATTMMGSKEGVGEVKTYHYQMKFR